MNRKKISNLIENMMFELECEYPFLDESDREEILEDILKEAIDLKRPANYGATRAILQYIPRSNTGTVGDKPGYLQNVAAEFGLPASAPLIVKKMRNDGGRASLRGVVSRNMTRKGFLDQIKKI